MEQALTTKATKMNLTRIAPGYYEATQDGVQVNISKIKSGTWVAVADWSYYIFSDTASYADAKLAAQAMLNDEIQNLTTT